MIINSINAFKYEEKKGPSGKKVADSEKEQCAICLEHICQGQMVKALHCSHKFHDKCINNWLR